MALSLVTAPAVEPVSTAEAKAHLRVDVSDDDTLIGTLITVARQHAEAFTRRALTTQTWDLKLDAFPCATRHNPRADIVLPFPPLQSVTSITYVDENGDSQTWDSAEYTVDAPSGPQAVHGRVSLAYDKVYPTTRDVVNAVTVRFVAGYGATADVPEGIKQGILVLIGHMYDIRTEALIGVALHRVPFASEALWWPYRAAMEATL